MNSTINGMFLLLLKVVVLIAVAMYFYDHFRLGQYIEPLLKYIR